MLDLIVEQWNAGFWGKVYVVLLVYLAISTAIFVIRHLTKSTQAKMKFIMKAQNDGRYVPGVISCFTLEGMGSFQYYNAEYMYVVNNKRYFVTYMINTRRMNDARSDKFEADSMLTDIKKYIILYYNEKNSKKVVCKQEVFLSNPTMVQVSTNQKQNRYRDVKKDWKEAIDLR